MTYVGGRLVILFFTEIQHKQQFFLRICSAWVFGQKISKIKLSRGNERKAGGFVLHKKSSMVSVDPQRRPSTKMLLRSLRFEQSVSHVMEARPASSGQSKSEIILRLS